MTREEKIEKLNWFNLIPMLKEILREEPVTEPEIELE